ncbi:glutamyl-tRNA amidotransferase [Aliivibrio finisterrensis]|nr:glutamyl-tRNA amidotransferase [Aliivibrio finisterrensis]RYU68370.1 glutamyl-tRNA amidotransferase [Aliivibrio finisterrensis]RYU71840.1 glutamyl-tRNA amidotransferase [Aliivibrio finisterrensis]
MDNLMPCVTHSGEQQQSAFYGALENKKFVVSDCINIKDTPNGLGNPTWLSQQKKAEENAPVVDLILQKGALFVGKTQVDEFGVGLHGNNPHYDPILNPNSPNRSIGGASCGAVAAVANGFADFGLGTDLNGGIRIPALYAGLYGFKASVNAINMDGVFSIAQEETALGWVARNLLDIRKVATVLTPMSPLVTVERIVVLDSLFSDVPEEAKNKLEKLLSSSPYDVVRSKAISKIITTKAAESFKVISATKGLRNIEPWIEQNSPELSNEIKLQLKWLGTLKYKDERIALEQKELVLSVLDSLLDEKTLILMPTTANTAPPISASVEQLYNLNDKILRYTSLASLADLPQLHLPWFTVNNSPWGISLLGKQGMDRQLIDAAIRWKSNQ